MLVAVIATTIVAPYLLSISIPRAIAEEQDRGDGGLDQAEPVAPTA